MNTVKLTAFAVLVVAGVAANAQVTVLNYTTNGTTYTQNFDSLAATGSPTWSNNSAFATVTGWSVWRANAAGVSSLRDSTINNASAYIAGDGSSNSGAIYSFGSANSTDRALGDVGSTATGDVLYMLALKNTTGDNLTQFNLGWDFEQWRNGGNTSAQTLKFDYKDLDATTLPLNANDASFVTGFVTPGGNFDGVTSVNTATAASVNGNVAGLTAGRGGTITGLNWASGDILVLRWWNDNNSGNDHGMGIDNVTFTAVPEPGTMAVLGLGLAAVARRRKASKA